MKQNIIKPFYVKEFFHTRCADLYNIWIWKDSQEKGKGRKFTVSDKNTLTKIVDIEPCLNHNIV